MKTPEDLTLERIYLKIVNLLDVKFINNMVISFMGNYLMNFSIELFNLTGV